MKTQGDTLFKTSRVSVVVPTFNGASFVEEALKSILSQSHPVEIIVVDDASTDGTKSILESFGDAIRVIHLSQNSGGPARPLNIGIDAAEGEFIAVLDQDDIFHRNKIEAQVKVMRDNPGLSFAFSSAELFGPGKKYFPNLDWKKEISSSLIDREKMTRLLLDHGNIVRGYPAFLFRKESWKKKGGLDESLQIASDYEFLFWLCREGGAYFFDEAHYKRRIHDRNLSWKRNVSAEVAKVKLKYSEKNLERFTQYLRYSWLRFKLMGSNC
jgi:glycosyltransferase involved in cell wall biosynthesis